MKKLIKIFGIIIGIVLIGMLTIPLFVDVDKFRPQIVKAANEKINGSLDLGKLSLSLWGKVHVGVDGLKISDLNKREVVSVKVASFDMPYSSLFSGAPLVTLRMKEPDITIIKNKDGKMNVMTLMKTAPVSGAPDLTQGTAGVPSDKKVELPSVAMNAHFGIYIENAKVVYKDEAMALTNTIDKLNLKVIDFSLSRKTELELWADLKTQMGTDLKIEGPIKLVASLTPELAGGEFKSAAVSAVFSADDLVIDKGTLFTKTKGIPANFKFDGSLDQASMTIKEAIAKFHNAEIFLKGTFQKEAGANFHFEAKPVELKPWSELIPMLKEYELEGRLGLKGDVKGKPEAIQYNAKLTIENLAAKGPHLKAKPLINGSVDITTDRIERFLIDLKGPGNELTLDGKMESFTKPVVTFSLASPKGLDLDQWIDFPKTEAAAPVKKSESNSKEASSSSSSSKSGEADLDASVDPVRKNPMMQNMSADGNFTIAFLKAKGTRIDDISGRFQFRNLIAAISNLKMRIFDGHLAGGFSTDLKPKEPQYNMNIALTGFDMQKAVESQFKAFKDTIIGKLSANVQGGGASFNSETAKRKLLMKGDFKMLNANFKTIDVSKMANDAINGSLGKIADKIPLLKGKSLHVNSNAGSKYDSITSSFTVSNGILDAPNLVAKAAIKNGIDLKGSTKIGLLDESLDAKWELTDTYHMTGADQLNVDIAGKQVKNFLAKGEKDPVILPISVGCKWSAPCGNYSQVPEYLAGVAAGRLKNVASDVVKDRIKDATRNALPNGLKGLFGH